MDNTQANVVARPLGAPSAAGSTSHSDSGSIRQQPHRQSLQSKRQSETSEGSQQDSTHLQEPQPVHARRPVSGTTTPRTYSGYSTPRNSRPNTTHNSMVNLPDWLEFKGSVAVTHLFQEQLREMLTCEGAYNEGVVFKVSRNTFVCQPPQLREVPGGFFDMVSQLNVSCAMTVNTLWVQSIIGALTARGERLDAIPLRDGLQLQVLPRMSDLPRCQKHHFAAFVLEPPVLVVWDDDPGAIMKRVKNVEENIMSLIWRDELQEEEGEGEKSNLDSDSDVEAGEPEVRPVHMTSALMVALSLALSIACISFGWRWLALQVRLDGNYTRLALVAASPAQLFVSMFFFQTVVGELFQIIGPISSVQTNSRSYSGKAPVRLTRYTSVLPHVTIQMPVYKEGLNAVIKPTVMSLKAAISTYEMQGGSANIFVNDDGMQLLPPDQARARQDFYEEHNIGWVSRPKHNPKPSDPNERLFVRKGKFKKASNMNYCLATSLKVEEKLQLVHRHEKWTQHDEDLVYERALNEVIHESEGRTWAAGQIRIGDYILIVDSDTRVPKDCLLDSVSELEQSPEVAILQHTSGVMMVSDSFFEQAVTWFTNLIYSSIKFAVASGDVCPFVGHNAFLRWQAIQDAASYVDPDDGLEKFWSESHVSEDFDMALRMQAAGYRLRFATYSNGGFQEGVSLTVYDELARWEKYAYGCNELMFQPLRLWIVKGPFSPVFRRFIFSNMPFYQKVTIMAYIGTYYAIGASWLLTVGNYFLTGWYFGYYDKYYIDSFAIYLSIIVVFPLAGNIALAVLRYRLGERSLLQALWENFKWMPLFTIFLGGLSLHVSKAILCHFFEIDIQWGATGKEVEEVNFLEEIPKLLKTFCGTFVFCAMGVALIVCGYYVFPREWQIRTFASIYPMGSMIVTHFSLPVLLNPALMKFTF